MAQATAHLDAVAGLGDTPAIDALRAHVAIGEGRMDEAILLMEPRSQVVIAVHRHDANEGERFAETRTGLDHIGWSVPRREDLDAWEVRLREHGVTFTPTVDLEEHGFRFSVLVFRDPDNIQFELCWMPEN